MSAVERPLIDIIAGARPNFVKIAPIIRALQSRSATGGHLRYRLIHTGQHYETHMSGVFFEQLNIPEPDVNLDAGSGTQAEQTASIMVRYEQLLLKGASQLCLVVGDVTSTMACAITAQKLKIPVAHAEGGIRSDDWTMPEEINRLITDAVTNWFFTTSDGASANLRRAGVKNDRIFFVGNTMIDTLLANIDRLRAPRFRNRIDLKAENYLVLTLHRPSNVDTHAPLQRTLEAISSGARDLPVIFPVHPRTAQILKTVRNIPPNIIIVEPQPYLEFNWMMRNAKAIITDSGGITEEATVHGVPCMTLRNSTERPETITIGTNELLGTDPAALAPAFERLFCGDWKKGRVPEKWDGRTGERIVSSLERLLPA